MLEVMPGALQAESVLLDSREHEDGLYRFCHQSGKLEPLSEFEGTKRYERVVTGGDLTASGGTLH